MFDLFSVAGASAARGPLVSMGVFAGAGLVSSIGPCMASRYLAAVALARHPSRVIGFASGITAAYLGIAGLASIAFRVARWTPYIYGLLAIAMTVWGVARLVAADRCDREHAIPAGGAVLAGFLSGCAVSPCCAPVLMVISANAAAAPALLALFVVAFTVGHLAPLIAPMVMGRVFSLPAWVRPALPSIEGGLIIALGAYYGVLA